MAKVKQVAVLLVGFFVVLLVVGFLAGSLINLLVPPSQAVYGDKVVEDIGGDNALIATLGSCVKVGEQNIPDGNFTTNLGQNLGWKNAKNISYVDTAGIKDFIIVWKDSPQNYPILSNSSGVSYFQMFYLQWMADAFWFTILKRMRFMESSFQQEISIIPNPNCFMIF